MIRRIEQVIVLCFSLFLIAPALLYAVDGPTEGYIFGKPQPPWPAWEELLLPEPAGRSAFVEAALDRSALRKEVIRIRNFLSLNLLGYIDNELVVSGVQGWLFYKPSLTAWACSNHDVLNGGLHRLRLLLRLAAANSIPFLMTVVPNKASMEIGHVGGRAGVYLPCYSEMEGRVRELLRTAASRHLIDHADVVDPRVAGRQTYLRTDTHWNRWAAFQAVAQLAARIEGAARPVETPKLESIERPTDLGNLFLLQEALEPSELVVSELTGLPPSSDFAERSTFVLYDSFYFEGGDFLRAWLPGVDLRMIGLPEAREIDLEEAELVVFESVERLLLNRLRDQDVAGWMSPLGRWIKLKMQDAAATCDWASSTDLLPGADLHDLSIDRSGRLEPAAKLASLSTTIPKAPASLPESSLCLEIEVGLANEMATPPDLRIHLGIEQDSLFPGEERGNFVHGRDIAVDFEGDRGHLSLILPESSHGVGLRVDFISIPEGSMLRALRVAPGGDPLPPPRILRDRS